MSDLLAALCLVAVIEGLFLLVAPAGWKRAAAQLIQTEDGRLRRYGVVMVVAGLLALQWVR